MRISDWSSDVCSSDLFVDDLHHLADTFPGNDDAIDLDTFRLVRGDAGQAVSVGRDGEKLVFEDVEEDAVQIIAGFFGGNGVAGAAEHLAELFSRSEEHTSELQSLMRISYAVFCLKKKIQKNIKYKC